jgi:hypothetical protein
MDARKDAREQTGGEPQVHINVNSGPGSAGSPATYHAFPLPAALLVDLLDRSANGASTFKARKIK